MRRRFAIPLITAVALAPWFWFKPETPAPDQRGELLSVVTLDHEGAWFGGLSGIEVSQDGKRFEIVTDRGHRAHGQLLREDDALVGFEFAAWQPLRDRFGKEGSFPHTDAEGIAWGPDGATLVSFEHAHRVLRYDTWDSRAAWPGYSSAWGAFALNQGMEALAADAQGTVYAIPEAVPAGAWQSLVYRRLPGEKWSQPFTIPVQGDFKPVGADFGPDGRLYLLERALYPFAFYSRVRSMAVTPDKVEDIRTEFVTPLGRHGNLEGISVWQDSSGHLRVTMVSDDNFKFFMRSELVEYRLRSGVAQSWQ